MGSGQENGVIGTAFTYSLAHKYTMAHLWPIEKSSLPPGPHTLTHTHSLSKHTHTAIAIVATTSHVYLLSYPVSSPLGDIGNGGPYRRQAGLGACDLNTCND